MNEQIKELRAHAGKLVAEGRSLSGVFEWWRSHREDWFIWSDSSGVPPFADGNEWRIVKPKKQLIDWSHPYFKGCATNYRELLVRSYPQRSWLAGQGTWVLDEHLLLATPANEYDNWQPFFSTPENDVMLRELAKMVKVEVRYWHSWLACYKFGSINEISRDHACNYRITGLQDGWTDNPEDL